MQRHVQAEAVLPDVYAGDPVLRSWLRRLLGDDGFAAAQAPLRVLAAQVAGPLRAAHRDAEAHPPTLHRYDGWGARVDRVETSAGWERLRVAAAEHALVGLPYSAPARATWGAGARVVQHALLHLYGPESATFTCPIAMADGAAALLSRPDVDASLRDAWLPRLIGTDPATTVTSGQWMTESQGGSDVGRATTTAVPAGDGSWRISGEKWFCSAIDSAIAIALARPDSAVAGSRGLAPFLVPRYAVDVPRTDGGSRDRGGATNHGGSRRTAVPRKAGASRKAGVAVSEAISADATADALAAVADPTRPAPGIRLHRLKDKLGTRAVATAEVGLDEAYCLPVGDPYRGGLARMMTLVLVTRLHNAAAAAAGMRRGLAYARAFADGREVAGGPLSASPVHRATLASLAVDAQAAFALTAHAFELLGQVEVDGDERARGRLRLVAPLAKLTTGKLAVASASEYLECFGGAGYVEDTGLPRLLRDAQVLPIWEGTTNVLALDVIRAVHGEPALIDDLLSQLDEATAQASGMLVGGAVDGLRSARFYLKGALAAVAADPDSDAVRAGARQLALTLGQALALVQLVGHAAATDDEATKAAAELWGRARLTADDIATDAHTSFELLCG
jgi:alkylation response protein AidB-like acyl-CoA dehydrogenase